MSLVEKIKQKARDVTVRRDSYGTYWLESVDVRKFVKLAVDSREKMSLVRLDDVLKILEDYKIISKDDWKEIVDLVKTFECLKKVEKKFAELGLDTKKETTK